ncbi:MAG: hypothetical protein QM767_21645 [Anaeromyxobacter sp.]
MAIRVPALLLLAALALGAAPARGQTPTMPGLYYPTWYDRHAREKDAEPQQFRLINYFFTRVSYTNTIGDPSGLKGVSLGPIGMPAGSMVYAGLTGPAAYVEQRWIPVVEYSPNFMDGRASFRAQVEVDYVWGRAANTVQPNEGGGLNADQVNIQTKNVNVAFYPWKDPDALTILVGTQAIYDNVLDPTRASLDEITRSGYKLAYAGSDATGVEAFTQRGGRSRLAWYPLDGAQPDKASENDPRIAFTWIAMLDHARELAPGTWLGASLWYLRDDTKGDAFAYEGLVRAGPSSGGLSAFTGTQPFQIERPTGQVVWAGLNGQHNIDFRTGRFAASGFFMFNAGQYESHKAGTALNEKVDVQGFGADLEGLWNYGRSVNDVVTLEALASNGDDDPTDGKYTGPFTLNYYGLPGAVFFNHRMLLLMPFTNTVGNYSGAVTDLSNQGYGLVAALGSASRDLIPNKLNLKLGAGYARTWAKPLPWAGATVSRGQTMGTEVNAELKYTYRYLMTFGLHGGYLVKGDWFDGNDRVTEDPWAVYTTFTWYAF